MPIVIEQPKRRRKLPVFAIIGGWIVIAGLLFYNHRGITDELILHNYKPTAVVNSLASDDTFTPTARDIFYVNQPVVTAQQAFSSHCPSGTERTVVLGCYHGNQDGIYVLKVDDSRLAGVEQVTAAHEMLHAAYDRLNRWQKQSVDAMLQDYYQHQLTDTVVKQQIDDYKKSEPNDVTNEMHSLFATEVDTLPANLEKYYQQYFTNRHQVVTQYNQYEAEFTNRQNTIKADDAQLDTMKSQIDSAEQSLDRQEKSLDSQRSQLDRLRSADDVSAYNSSVPAYNAAVDSYNAQIADLKNLISRYNNLVQSRNAIAAETNQLTAEISNQLPATK